MRTVVVTGGSQGIGRALVERFAAAGDTVITCARSFPPRTPSQRIVEITADLATADGVEAFAAEVRAHVTSIDVLVHNAALNRHLDPHDPPSPADMREVVAVNISAVAELTNHLLPLVEAGSDPVIVTCGSIVARSGAPRSMLYAASKAALQTYTDGLRRALAPDGIRVVEFVPPLTDTGMARAVSSSRKVSPDDAARALVRGLGTRRRVISHGTNGLLVRVDAAAGRIVARATR